MVEAYKILKSLMKNVKRLVIHLGTDEDQASQSLSLQAIQNLVNETLCSMTTDGELKSLLAVSSKKDQSAFVGTFQNLA